MSDPTLGKVLNALALRYFQEAAAAGSFRQAAERIRVAASAIHRQVALLEAELGAPLFERRRGRGGLKLTAAGEVLLYRAGTAMHELALAVHEIDNLRGLERGRASVGVTDVLAHDFMPDFLERFTANHPRIDFAVQVNNTPQLLELLLEDKLDVVIAYNVPARIGVTTIIELNLQSYVLVPLTHPLAARAHVSLAECASYKLAMPEESQYLRGLLDRMFRNVGIRPTPFVTTNSYEFMRQIVQQGLAISIQTRLSAAAAARRPGIVYVPLRESLAEYSLLTCCTQTNRRLTQAARFVVDDIHAALRELQPGA